MNVVRQRTTALGPSLFGTRLLVEMHTLATIHRINAAGTGVGARVLGNGPRRRAAQREPILSAHTAPSMSAILPMRGVGRRSWVGAGRGSQVNGVQATQVVHGHGTVRCGFHGLTGWSSSSACGAYGSGRDPGVAQSGRTVVVPANGVVVSQFSALLSALLPRASLVTAAAGVDMTRRPNLLTSQRPVA